MIASHSYLPQKIYGITWRISSSVEREHSASWRQFQGHSLSVIAHTQLQTRKEGSPLAEQLFGMCNIHIRHIVFELCVQCMCDDEQEKLKLSCLFFATLSKLSGTNRADLALESKREVVCKPIALLCFALFPWSCSNTLCMGSHFEPAPAVLLNKYYLYCTCTFLITLASINFALLGM